VDQRARVRLARQRAEAKRSWAVRLINLASLLACHRESTRNGVSLSQSFQRVPRGPRDALRSKAQRGGIALSLFTILKGDISILRVVSLLWRFNMYASLIKLLKNEDGATAIEYGLIAALIAVAAVTVMATVGTNLSNTFNCVAGKL
jgi:pilus assembly protein Flp/PilA